MVNLEQLSFIFLNDSKYYGQNPKSFDPFVNQDYGVRFNTHKLVGSQRITSVESAQDVGDYTHLRKMPLQLFNAMWNQESMIGVNMYTELQRLYDNQSIFWLRMDDEMSRNYGKLTPYYDTMLPGAYKPFFTPTYPIFPYGWTDGNPVVFNQDDLLVGAQYWPGNYSVDQQTGLVLLAPYPRVIDKTIELQFRYMWRAPVYISSWDLYPQDLTQQVYMGQLEFTQVEYMYPNQVVGIEVYGKVVTSGYIIHE